ncbi:hypothetical protein OQA88_3765 [Cercophora sp. LCS_1]
MDPSKTKEATKLRNSDDRGKNEPVKRRACDECRAKKLACSKEIDGCARCKREGIKCVYSAQKPMGRPRKRTHNEVEPQVQPEADSQEASKESSKELETPKATEYQHVDIVPPFDSTLSMELDLSFLDFENPDMDFFNLIDTNFPSTEPFTFQGLDSLEPLDTLPPPTKKPNTNTSFPNPSPPSPATFMGDYMGQTINWSGPLESPPTLPHTEIPRSDIDRIMAAEMPSPVSPPSSDKLPSLSPSLSATSVPSQPACACLSTLYLALSSLQSLPTSVSAAIKVARLASRTAHDATKCLICGDPPLELCHPPPVASFQNLMMLGALLPSLSNTYMRILTMIDERAAAADAAREKIRFQLDDYGGLWGNAAKGYAATPSRERISEEPIEPALWRLTVRALLKIDVYGIGHKDMVSVQPGNDCCRFMGDGFIGLKDIISLVEERSRKRHAELDLALASGRIVKPEGCSYDVGGEPPCMKIISIAKESMRGLVIP